MGGAPCRTKIRRECSFSSLAAGGLGPPSRGACCARGTRCRAWTRIPEAHARLEVNLDRSWEDSGGQFTVGTGLEEEALTAAGIERADAFIASTDGDNTNIVIAQIAKRKFNVPDGDRADPRSAAGRVVREAGGQHGLPDTRRDRDAGEGGPGGRRVWVAADGRGQVHHHRRGRQGRLEPGPGAARQGQRGHGDRGQPEPVHDRRAGARAQHPVRGRVGAVGAGAGRVYPARTW